MKFINDDLKMERNNFHDYFSLIRRFNFSTIPKEERKLDTKAIAWISNDFFFRQKFSN